MLDYVELEEPGKIIDWNSDNTHKETWKKIRDHYWWTKKRLKIQPFEFEDIPDSELKQRIEPAKKNYATYYRALGNQMELEISRQRRPNKFSSKQPRSGELCYKTHLRIAEYKKNMII